MNFKNTVHFPVFAFSFLTSVGSVNAVECGGIYDCLQKSNEAVLALRKVTVDLQEQIDSLKKKNETLTKKLDKISVEQSLISGAVKYIIFARDEGCPPGWESRGNIGFIMQNKDYSGHIGTGGEYNNSWTWTHPNICWRP